jgi:tRNA-splicing ligase RtcB
MQRVINDTKAHIKIWASDLEDEAEKQVRNVASLPFIHHHVAVMADAHVGKGSTVGTVIATRGAIIPSCVGVDIGCGMIAVKLPFKVDMLGDSLDKLRASIERSVPVAHHGNKDITERVEFAFNDLGSVLLLGNKHTVKAVEKSIYQLGSLGGGNHFIEVCRDLDGNAWVVLHSGSRNIGKTLAEIHIDNAKGLMKRYFIDLPDPDLAYLVQESLEFHSYIHDLHWAQRYAKANRNEMMLRVLKDVSRHVYGEDKGEEFMTTFRVDCHHNYTQMENHFNANIWVTRKGAVSAREGEYGIIPGSMGTKSYIVRGKGNLDSFCSCSHGAGRRMSRSKARSYYTLEDLVEQTAGVECRKDADVIDEIPGAYKSIDEVMSNQSDLVEVVAELKQLLCIKG